MTNITGDKRLDVAIGKYSLCMRVKQEKTNRIEAITKNSSIQELFMSWVGPEPESVSVLWGVRRQEDGG